MARLILVIFFVLSMSFMFGQNNVFQLFGGDKNDFGVSLIEKDGGVGYLLLGSTRSYGNGSSDFYVISLDINRVVLSELSYGGIHHDLPNTIIPIGNGEYILFGSTLDFKPGALNYSLFRVNSLGQYINKNIIYNKRIDIGFNILKLNDNGYLLIGMASGNDRSGQSKIIKLDSHYEVEWEKEFGENGIRDYGFDCIENDNGYLLLNVINCDIKMSASFGGMNFPSDVNVIQIDDDGDILWEYTYEGDDYDYTYSFVQSEEFIYIAVNTRSEDAQSFDIRLIKLNLNGDFIDSYSFGGEGFEYVYKIIEDSDKNLVLCGTSSTMVERPAFYAIKINGDGELIWEKKIERNASIYAYDMIETKNHNYLFTGKYAHDVNNSDIFLLELDKNGIASDFTIGKLDKNVLIYPNPSDGQFIIKAENLKITDVTVYNAIGKMIYSRNYDTRLISLDFSFLTSGIYLLSIGTSDNSIKHEKITIY
jgi:hypothetical protein